MGFSVTRSAVIAKHVFYIAVIMTVLSVVVASIVSSYVHAEDEKELQSIFRKYCGACHRGRIAPNWDGTIKKIKEWASKYASLDEAARKEYHYRGKTANSYDELMKYMREFAPGISDEDFKKLYEFFKNVFLEAKGGAASPSVSAAVTKTITTTVTTTLISFTTTTVTKTVTEHHTVTVRVGGETGSALTYSLVALIVVVVVIGGLAFYALRRA